MIEVFPGLFVGDANDLIHADGGNDTIAAGWFVISAAKDPWHRRALNYTTRGAPKDHPEYLIAARERRLILNLIDVDDPAFVREEIVTAAMQGINAGLSSLDKVLIHCNQGQSRAPTLALLWLKDWLKIGASYDDAAIWFKAIYPTFEPSKGMEGYARAHWEVE